MTRNVVLSSGGVDSTTCISLAVEQGGADSVSTVSVFYNQKHSKELECAKAVAEYYGVEHYLLDLSEVFKQSNCSLLASSTEAVPEGSYEEQQSKSDSGIVSTYVPFRNGLMLSAVASFAMSLYPNDKIKIWLGNHADDAAGNAYPDCSEQFVEAMSQAISQGTEFQVQLLAPFTNFNKTKIVSEGLRLKTPYHLTSSCYNGGDRPCRKCGTCIDREKAFLENGVVDPLLIDVEGE